MDPVCPNCGSSLRELPESEWPAAGEVPEGTVALYLCDGNHRVIVAASQVSG